MIDAHHLDHLEAQYRAESGATVLDLEVGIGSASLRTALSPVGGLADAVAERLRDTLLLAGASLAPGRTLGVGSFTFSLSNPRPSEGVHITARVVAMKDGVLMVQAQAADLEGVSLGSAQALITDQERLRESEAAQAAQQASEEKPEQNAPRPMPKQKVWKTQFGPLFLN